MTTESTHPTTHGGKANRWILGVMGVVLLGGLGWWLRDRKHGAAVPAAPSAESRVVPVLVATVTKADVPIYIEGLGNVVPLSTVNVRSQVEGRLDRVVFKEGQNVKRGDLLAQIDPRPYMIQLHQGEATLAKDTAQLRNGKLNLERYRSLREQNLIPQQQVDDQQTVVDQSAATILGDQVQVDNARLQLDYARIVAPIDGVTGIRLVDPGNIVHANDATGIVVITQLDPIAVVFTLPEDDLARVSKQLARGPVSVEAYSRDGVSKVGTGQLALIDNQINATTATIRLKATFANADRTLWPNEFIKARLLLTTRKDVLVVPATVVQRGPQGTFAYVVSADKTVAMRPVEVDSTEGETTILAKGLAAGDVVVADGQNGLRPGSKVAPRTAERPTEKPADKAGETPGEKATEKPKAAK